MGQRLLTSAACVALGAIIVAVLGKASDASRQPDDLMPPLAIGRSVARGAEAKQAPARPTLPVCPKQKIYRITGYTTEDIYVQEKVPEHLETRSFPVEYGWKKVREYIPVARIRRVDPYGDLDREIDEIEQEGWEWGVVRQAHTDSVVVHASTRTAKKRRSKPVYAEVAPATDCIVRGVVAAGN